MTVWSLFHFPVSVLKCFWWTHYVIIASFCYFYFSPINFVSYKSVVIGLMMKHWKLASSLNCVLSMTNSGLFKHPHKSSMWCLMSSVLCPASHRLIKRSNTGSDSGFYKLKLNDIWWLYSHSHKAFYNTFFGEKFRVLSMTFIGRQSTRLVIPSGWERNHHFVKLVNIDALNISHLNNLPLF